MKSEEKKRTLVLHDVKPEDAGEYVCEVGTRRTTTTIQVTKEVIEEKPKGTCNTFDQRTQIIKCMLVHGCNVLDVHILAMFGMVMKWTFSYSLSLVLPVELHICMDMSPRD